MGTIDIIKASGSGLLKPSHSYKPFRYPWAYEFWHKFSVSSPNPMSRLARITWKITCRSLSPLKCV